MKFLLLFNNLRFASKMAMLGALTLIMVLVPTIPLIGQLSDDVDFNSQELSGVAPAQQTLALLVKLQQHRGLSTQTLNGAEPSQRLAVAAQVDAFFKQLSETVQRGLADPSVMRQIGELKTSWQQLENDVASGRLSSADSFQRHSQLIEQIVQETLNQVLDSSGLSYDPVAESYHLIIAGLQNAPRLMEEIAKVQGDILATSTAQSPSSDDAPSPQLSTTSPAMPVATTALKTLSLNSAQLLASAQQPYVDLLRNLRVAASLSSQLEVQKLSEQSGKIANHMQQLPQLLNQSAETNPLSLSLELDRITQDIFQISSQVNTVLNGLLMARDQEFRSQRQQLLSIVIACGVCFFALAIYLVMSFSRGLHQSVSTARAIMAKDFTKARASQRQDEIGALQRAMFEMNKGLELAERQAHELAQRAEADAQKAAADAIMARENQRIRQALDETSTNVLLVDARRTIIYANHSMMSMLRKVQTQLSRELPSLNVGSLLGSLVDVFAVSGQPASQFLLQLEQAKTSDLLIADVHFRVTATVITTEQGERLGTVLEWLDRSQEVQAEQDVEAVVQAAVRGDFHLRVNEAHKQGFMLKIAEGLNSLTDTCERSLSDISQVLGAIADGDLTARVTGSYLGTFEALKNGCNQTADTLSQMLLEIRDAAATINSAADEISRGNTDLSSRTEEQASSLEETASSMEQLTGTVRQNAENAQQANRLAAEASTVAIDGGQLIGQVVQMMAAINDSAQKIADIIGVIDGIAFQTNILALNAAVEAARAGEQGRGFAVVASEVRSLAQRSANAAKDIKGLISDSVAKISNGNQLVGRSGQTMQDIVVAIKRVNDLMSDIAAASIEQATGLDEVSKSVSQMDNITQQNAALVEEAAAAAESLLSQANQLSNQVLQFKLAESATPQLVTSHQGRRSAANGVKAGHARQPLARSAQPLQLVQDDEWEAF